SPLDDATGGCNPRNSPAGTVLTLDIAIDWVQATATALTQISGGAEIESEEAFPTRML
ncbi:phage baseplate protein, partial [Yersinia pestis]|nr:phage baseplate protein [Yersinia pestis]